jgi:hypothetical protein
VMRPVALATQCETASVETVGSTQSSWELGPADLNDGRNTTLYPHSHTQRRFHILLCCMLFIPRLTREQMLEFSTRPCPDCLEGNLINSVPLLRQAVGLKAVAKSFLR